MSYLKVLIPFLIGCSFTFLLMKTQLATSNIDVKLTLNVISVLFSILTLIIAFIALNNWRTQIKHKLIYDTALALEKSLVNFLLATVSEDADFNNDQLVIVNEQIRESRFILQQREFEVSLLKNIELGIRKAIQDIKSNGFVTSNSHNNLLSFMHELSNKLNQTFR